MTRPHIGPGLTPVEVEELTAYVAALEAELAEARRDTARLDYDELHPNAVTVVRILDGRGAAFLTGDEPNVLWHQTRRAAIDAAMGEKP